MSALLIALTCNIFATAINVDIPVNQWPMLYAHDFATGYLKSTNILKQEIVDWAQTQKGSITDLLNCGARAFDWRGYYDGTELKFHHGSVEVPQLMEDTLLELKSWLRNHTEQIDFVLITAWDCTNSKGFSNCSSLASDLYNKHGFYQFSQADLSGVTMKTLLERSKLPSGGYAAIMIEPPTAPYYNEKLACSGYTFEEKGKSASDLTTEEKLSFTYTCYKDSSSKSRPLNEMWAYVKNVTTLQPQSEEIYSLQALWQETDASVEIGIAHFSSLVKEESWSELNSLILDRLSDFEYINLLEVNNMCDRGPDLLAKLRARIQ